jgi:salicylate synthetase
MSVEASPDDAAATVELPAGVRPADVIAELVAALPGRDGDDYLVYERNGEWTLASGVPAAIEFDSDELRLMAGDVVERPPWMGNPGAVIGEAVDRLLLATDHLYGWVAFEFGAYRFGDADTRYTRVLQRLLVGGMPAAPAPTPVDGRCDGANFRGRVATAIAEIDAGRY